MKPEKISMKWKVYACLLVFTGLLLAMLWVFQTVYLGVFYKQIKKSELDKAMDTLISGISQEDYGEVVSDVGRSYDIHVFVMDGEGNLLYTSREELGQFYQKWGFREWYNKAAENGGEYQMFESRKPEDNLPTKKISGSFKDQDPGNQPVPEFQNRSLPGMRREVPEEKVTWIRILEDSQGGEMVLFLESTITPVEATIHTLRIQLMYISVILIFLSLFIAWILSKNLSSSIIKVNQSAKELAKANYGVTFDAKDYREIAELSETLNFAAAELGKSEKFQHELLANVSHDLRTPLTMIIAYAEVMRDLPGENTPENVQVVIDEARRLTALVNDMLDISKLQAGVMTLDISEYNLTESICQVMGRFSKLKEQENYQIDFYYEDEIYVEADEYKINQVIYNLLSNAINYTGEDKRVAVSQTCHDGWVRIEVRDTGEGIETEVLPYVWERYYKVDKNHRRAVLGTGLGLSIVKNILILHGAPFGVESQEGVGSIFWFELKINIS